MPEPATERVISAPAPSLCLAFVNTRYWRGTPLPSEGLDGFDALQRWLRESGAVDAATADRLQALLATDAAAAQRLFDDALEARESLYGLLQALAVASPPPAHALAALAHRIAGAPPRDRLVLTAAASGWRVAMRRPDAAEVLAPVWWSAGDLVLAAGRLRLRCCANPQCGWLFLDDSKSGSRRWCSMSACGNRAKVQRHAQRQREVRPPSSR